MTSRRRLNCRVSSGVARVFLREVVFGARKNPYRAGSVFLDSGLSSSQKYVCLSVVSLFLCLTLSFSLFLSPVSCCFYFFSLSLFARSLGPHVLLVGARMRKQRNTAVLPCQRGAPVSGDFMLFVILRGQRNTTRGTGECTLLPSEKSGTNMALEGLRTPSPGCWLHNHFHTSRCA